MRINGFFSQISQLLTNRAFILNILGIILFVTLVVFGILQWLKHYTNHGQKLEMPDYINQHISEAQEDADDRSFKMIVNDSVHIVGKPGGIIQNQNPKGGSLVKEDRKVYVTTTKYSADVIVLSKPLLPMYGKDYESIRTQLQQKAIASEIRDFVYDPLAPGTILEVWHNNKKISSSSLTLDSYKIERGSRLSFVVSTSDGGTFTIPNVVGLSYSQAEWTIQNSKFRIGKVSPELNNENLESAIIVEQYPRADGTQLESGQAIDLKVKSP